MGSTAALTPAHILAAPPEALRGAGLSGRKLEYLVGLAQAFSGRPGWEQELEGEPTGGEAAGGDRGSSMRSTVKCVSTQNP